MADEFNKEIKSNRLLQSLRYTAAAQDNQEAYTRVLDLNAQEVYTQQQYIPSSSLPYSGSGQDLQFITANIDGVDVNIAQYYFEVTCSKSSRDFNPGSGTKRGEVWFTISGSGYNPVTTNAGDGISSTTIHPNQLTNWVSNKYATSSLALNNAENGGYNVLVKNNGSNINSSLYQFDYKTGVLEFTTNANSPLTTDTVTVSGYRYVGKTLADETFGTSGAAGIFASTGSVQSTTNNLQITGSLLASGSSVNFEGATSVSATTFTTTTATITSASIGHLVVNNIISASTVITSGSNTFGDDTTDTQTLIGTVKMTGSAEVTGSFEVSGSVTITDGDLSLDGTLSLGGFTNVSASLAAALTASLGDSGIFITTGSVKATTNTLQITGSTLQSTPLASPGAGGAHPTSSGAASKYAMVVSQSVWHYNANVGVPSTNPWGNSGLEGSYFSNFDHNTDISVMLRFVAGLLSSSAPNATSNAKTYNGITSTQGGTQTGTAPAGYVPQNATDPTVVYLESKGFASDGGVLFSGITPIYDYNASGVYKRNYSSAASSATSGNPSSSADAQLFGLGTIGLAFAVSGTLNWSFSSGSNKVATLTSQSENLLTTTGPGTSNGLTIGNIQTANPAVIPNAFQDGKFANIYEAEISNISGSLYPNGLNFQTTESVGYYQLTSSIKIRSGSAAASFSPDQTDQVEIFYAPVDELNTNINTDSPQNITLSLPYSASLTVVSRSLSGAPYMISASYEISNSIAGVFNPLYAGNTTNLVRMFKASDSDGIIEIEGATNHNITLSTDSSGEITTNNVVFNSSGVVRNSGVPHETDITRLSGSIKLVAGGGATNIQQSSTLDDLGFTISSSAKNRTGTTVGLRADDFAYFYPGTFGKPAASQSMAYYGRAQGYDAATATGTTETFVGETLRRKLNDALLSVTSADAYGTTYSDGLVDSTLDLQVKPGFLIKPGGTYKYWLPTIGSSIYRYYVREFDLGANSFSSMTIDVGKTLKSWRNTSDDGVAIGILYQSGASGNILIDVQDTSGDFSGGTVSAGTTGTNPFGVDISVQNNSHSDPPTGDTFKIAQAGAPKNIVLNASNRKYQVIIRYRGDEAPVTGITVAYQA